MKHVTLLAALVVLCLAQLHAQIDSKTGVPQAFPYSSQIRDAQGALLTDRFIALRVTMHSGAPDGPAVYVEIDTTTTSPTGIFTVVVGGGSVISGSFDSIPWMSGQVYQQVELDEYGGTNFSDMGTTQLLSLPYALAAGNGVTDVKFDDSGKISIKSADGREEIVSETASWLTTGNKGTNGFIGTVDNTDLVLKRDNNEGLRLRANNAVTTTGSLGVGVTQPATSLDVSGGITVRDTVVTVSGMFTLNPGNHSLIFVNSTSYPSNALCNMGPGLQRGQIIVIVVGGGMFNRGISFANNTFYKTRVNVDGRGVGSSYGGTINYTDGNTITLLWNGNEWVQLSSSITKP